MIGLMAMPVKYLRVNALARVYFIINTEIKASQARFERIKTLRNTDKAIVDIRFRPVRYCLLASQFEYYCCVEYMLPTVQSL